MNYDNLEFIDCLNTLIDAIILNNEDTDLSMLEINSFLVINICIKGNKDKNIKLNTAVDSLSKKYNTKTNIYFDDNSYNIRLSISITNRGEF